MCGQEKIGREQKGGEGKNRRGTEESWPERLPNGTGVDRRPAVAAAGAVRGRQGPCGSRLGSVVAVSLGRRGSKWGTLIGWGRILRLPF